MMIETIYPLFLANRKICTDSRKIEAGSIFFALKGENFNGNAFAKEAMEKGCEYAVIDEPYYKTAERYILVDNVLHTLQKLAAYHRRKKTIPVIGIAGSNGKTTTKELLSSVLSKKYKTHSTKGNQNNHIGVPLTLLSMPDDTVVAVVEMGTNHVGELAELCEITQPDYGIITNIGKEHLEGFGGFEEVIKAESELYDYLRKTNGTVFLNSDNNLLNGLCNGINSLTYSKTKAHIIGKQVSSGIFLSVEWKKRGEVEFNSAINSRLYGEYNFYNILSAICAGVCFNVDKNDIKNAIESYLPSNNRSQFIQKGNNTLFLDAYNANPDSMNAALDTFRHVPAEKKVVILGDMLELGSYSTVEHQMIVEKLTEMNVSLVLLIGRIFYSSKKPNGFQSYITTDEARIYLVKNKISNASILIKGSRGIKLESLVDVL